MVYKIPNTIDEFEFCSTIGNELKKIKRDQESLFILYYGGHASAEKFTDTRLLKKESHAGSPQIEWSSSIRILFKTGVVCSKLFIFDCCYAGAMIDLTLPWEPSCELFGACGPDVEASAIQTSSFTKAFLNEIRNNTYEIWELNSALTSTENLRKYNLRKCPHYQKLGPKRDSLDTAIIKKVGTASEFDDDRPTPPDMLKRLDSMSDAAICIAITLKSTGKAFLEEFDEIKKDWRRWLKFPPTGCDDIIVKACDRINLVAAFNSDSCTTIWSFPIWLWDAMAPVSGYQHIGIVRSQNLALAASGTQNDLAAPNYSSSRILGEVSLSPQSPDNLPPTAHMVLERRIGEDDPRPEPKKPHSTKAQKIQAQKPTEAFLTNLSAWKQNFELPEHTPQHHAPASSPEHTPQTHAPASSPEHTPQPHAPASSWIGT